LRSDQEKLELRDNGRRALFTFKAQMTGTNLATGLVVVKIGV